MKPPRNNHFQDDLGTGGAYHTLGTRGRKSSRQAYRAFMANPPNWYGNTIPAGYSNSMYFLDIETLGYQYSLPVITASFASAEELDNFSAGRKLTKELYEEISNRFDVLVRPQMVIKGNAVDIVGAKRPLIDALKNRVGGGYDAAELLKILNAQLGAGHQKSSAGEIIDMLVAGKFEAFKAYKPGVAPVNYETFLAEKIKHIHDSGGGTLLVHNLPFESGFLGARMPQKEFTEKIGQYLYGFSLTGTAQPGIQAGLYATGSKLQKAAAIYQRDRALFSQVPYETGENLFRAFTEMLDTPSRLVKVGDTMDMFRAVSAMAESKGFLLPGVNAGLKIDDWLQAIAADPEAHRPTADALATRETATRIGRDIGENMIAGRPLTDNQMSLLHRLSSIRGDTARYRKDLMGTLSRNVTESLSTGLRVREGRISEGRFYPRLEPTVGAYVEYDPVSGKRIAKLEEVIRGRPKTKRMTSNEVFEYQWARMNEAQRAAIGADQFNVWRAEVNDALNEVKFQNDYVKALDGLADDHLRISAEVNISRKIHQRMMGRTSEKISTSLADTTGALTRGGRLTRAGGVLSYAAGAGIGLAASYLISTPAEAESEQLRRGGSSRPIFSTLAGVGIAGGAYYAASKYRPDFISRAGGLSAYAGIAMAGYAGLTGLHDILNSPESPDFGGELGVGLVSAGWFAASALKPSDLSKFAQYTDRRIPEITERLLGSKAGQKIIGGVKESPYLFAGMAALAILGGASMLGERGESVPTGMQEDGYSQSTRTIYSDFGSPFSPKSLISAKALVNRGGKALPHSPHPLGQRVARSPTPPTGLIDRRKFIFDADLLPASAKGQQFERINIHQGMMQDLRWPVTPKRVMKEQIHTLQLPPPHGRMPPAPKVSAPRVSGSKSALGGPNGLWSDGVPANQRGALSTRS